MNEIFRNKNVSASDNFTVTPDGDRSGLGEVSGKSPAGAFSLALSKVLQGTISPVGQSTVLPTPNLGRIPVLAANPALITSFKSTRTYPLAGSQQGDTGDADNFHERAIGLRAYRQQLLASNIANADTPGYKAVDIDIQTALRNGQSVGSNIPLQYEIPSQASVDGNTVDMDVQRVKFAENAFMYDYEVDRVKKKEMDDLLKNIPY